MTQTVQLPIAVTPTCASAARHVPGRDGGRFDVLDPATGRRAHRRSPTARVEDALAAVDAAHDGAAAAGPRPPRASAPRSCAGAFELMTAAGRASWPS